MTTLYENARLRVTVQWEGEQTDSRERWRSHQPAEFRTRGKCDLYKMNDPNSHGSERALADILT